MSYMTLDGCSKAHSLPGQKEHAHEKRYALKAPRKIVEGKKDFLFKSFSPSPQGGRVYMLLASYNGSAIENTPLRPLKGSRSLHCRGDG
jgi:hypothetical protein